MAGTNPVLQQSKDLPALHKDILRKAVQEWIAVHFFLPVAGKFDGERHINIMEPFVTFVWAYYTQHQRPKVPTLTDVGRFLFTYIWRGQHPLFGYIAT